MGALPSRESNEDPSTVFFANCGSHVVFHVPMTPHYFPSPAGLAFQQLFHARNNQSALYCFDMKDVSSVLPPKAAEAFCKAQDEDWGSEAEEVDPSVHYYDDEINEKIRECNGTLNSNNSSSSNAKPLVGKHFKRSIEDPESLYRVLIQEPTAGTLLDTDAEMCEIFEVEQKWRAAVAHEFAKAAKSQNATTNYNSEHQKEADSDMVNRDAAVVGPSTANLPPPPKKFLYPLPHAIALRMTTEEEEEMRAEYCRLHKIPYVAPHFHEVKPGATPPMMNTASLAQLGVPRTSTSTCFVACPLPTPLPLVERRRYHFEDDPEYRDGRVHLVEEHGVLYHFAYFPKKRRDNDATDQKASIAATTGGVTNTPIVLDRCLHDVVYSEEPDTSVTNNKQLAAAATSSSTSAFGTTSNFNNDPEAAPAKRYGRCARCGARIEQRMDYTQLRRLKATRKARREMRRAEEFSKQQQEHPCLLNSKDSENAAAQHEAWAAFAAAREAGKREGHHHHANNNNNVHDSQSGDAPGSDSDLEVVSHTEQVEEEGETEFVINIAPVRIVGMDGLLPSRTRGTPWLRGYEHEDEAAADAYVEQLERKPPVMRTCRFIEGSVGDKIVNRAALVTMLSYRPMCRQAGLSNALTRPVWSTCVLSNIPYLQMVRETFFRAKAAVAEIDDKDMLLRRWLDVVDRENNFYNFINANLYMMRNFTPPERTVRKHDLVDDMNSTTTAASRFRNGSIGTEHSNSIASSSILGSPTGRTRGHFEGGAAERLATHPPSNPPYDNNAKQGASPLKAQERGDDEEANHSDDLVTRSNNGNRNYQQLQEKVWYKYSAGGDVPSSVSLSSSAAATTTTTTTTITTLTTFTTAAGHHDGLSTSGRSMQPTKHKSTLVQQQQQQQPRCYVNATNVPISRSLSSRAERTPDTAAAATAGAAATARDDVRKDAKYGDAKATATSSKSHPQSSGSSGCVDGTIKSTEQRRHHLTRDLEVATIGRPEGYGPHDVVEEEFEDDSDGSDCKNNEIDLAGSGSGGVICGNDAAARAVRRKEEKRQAKISKKTKSKKSQAEARSDGGMLSTVKATTAATKIRTVSKERAMWPIPVTAGVAMHSPPLTTAGQSNVSNKNTDEGNDDGSEASGKPTELAHSAALQQQHLHYICGSTGRSPLSPQTKDDVAAGRRRNEGEDQLFEEENDDFDLRMEEEGQTGSSGKTKMKPTLNLSSSSSGSNDNNKKSHAGTLMIEDNLHQLSSSSPLTPPPQRNDVPLRPNFQLFSSRLEPHAPLSLCSLFDYDVSADAVTLAAAAMSSEAGSPAEAVISERGTGDAMNVTAVGNGSGEFNRFNTVLPSYVQHDVLLENERRQAEPKLLRRPSHALYECGMLTTTRGRSFLFLLREDCVHALLYYLSSAAAPIFIGAYIEPVDTTSVSYGGAVRLQRPSALDIPLEEDEDEDAGCKGEESDETQNNNNKSGQSGGEMLTKEMSRAKKGARVAVPKRVGDGGAGAALSADSVSCSNRNDSSNARRVIIEPVEGMEVMAEYYKSKGLITCFSVSDVDRIAPGPSAAHRLRKMILPPAQSFNGSQNNLSSYLRSEERTLALRQAREAAQYGHTFTYAVHEFCDGDLVVYNFEKRKWEHYEHVQLRRRFAAKAAAAAAASSPLRGYDGNSSSISSSPESHSSVRSTSFNSTDALGFMSSAIHPNSVNGGGGGIRGEDGVWCESGRVQDDVAAVVDGSTGGASFVPDASMSARLLCVGLDELLLSWTKWVVDNRFYEDRSDLGWLKLPDGSPIQLGGRYFLWSFRHNHQRYFYGVIPKFAKGRLRRLKLIERNRKKKKEADTPHEDTNRAATNNNSDSKETKLKKRFGEKSKSRSLSTTANGGRSTPRPRSIDSNGKRSAGGNKSSNASSHADPTHLNAGLSSLRSGSNNSGCGGAMQTQLEQQQQQLLHSQSVLSGAVRTQGAPGTTAAGAFNYRPEQQQQRQWSANSPLCDTAPAASVIGGFAQHQQQLTIVLGRSATAATDSNSSRFPSTHTRNNCVRPALSASLTGSNSTVSVTATATRDLSARRAPLLGPPPSQPQGLSIHHRGIPRSPSITSPAQPPTVAGGVGGPNYYYQYGGNTFIQDGKRHENEYYPPLPPNTPFHTASQAAAAKLVPLPHPQSERGGIPAMFRYFGPVGHPSSISRSSTLPRNGLPLLLTQPQQRLSQLLDDSSCQHVFHSSSAPTNHSERLSTNPCVAGSMTVTSTGVNPGTPVVTSSNLTVRVRRRGMNAAAVPAVAPATSSAAPSGPSSLSASVTTVALWPAPTGRNSSFNFATNPTNPATTIISSHNNNSNSTTTHPGPPSFPATPVLQVEAQPCSVTGTGFFARTTQVNGGVAGNIAGPPTASAPGGISDADHFSGATRHLSPTSMLPANLINEGSKTKGESVLRVDEDLYVQREAFRWNPYASTKWSSGNHETGRSGE